MRSPTVYTCQICGHSFEVRPPAKFEVHNGELVYVYADPQPHPCPKCGTETAPPRAPGATV
jgi:rRNA maturation protein Nop10